MRSLGSSFSVATSALSPDFAYEAEEEALRDASFDLFCSVSS